MNRFLLAIVLFASAVPLSALDLVRDGKPVAVIVSAVPREAEA